MSKSKSEDYTILLSFIFVITLDLFFIFTPIEWYLISDMSIASTETMLQYIAFAGGLTFANLIGQRLE